MKVDEEPIAWAGPTCIRCAALYDRLRPCLETYCEVCLEEVKDEPDVDWENIKFDPRNFSSERLPK